MSLGRASDSLYQGMTASEQKEDRVAYNKSNITNNNSTKKHSVLKDFAPETDHAKVEIVDQELDLKRLSQTAKEPSIESQDHLDSAILPFEVRSEHQNDMHPSQQRQDA